MESVKRGAAAVIDIFIIRFITIAVYAVAVSISHKVHNRVIRITTSRDMGRTVYLIVLYIALMLCIHFLYFFLWEQKGSSIGKKLAKYQPDCGGTGKGQAMRIALCKTGACIFYVVTAPYFLFTGKMPYDKVRSSEEKHL